MKKQVERRFLPQEFRVASDGQPPRISGYAAVFNSMSEDLGFFREEIDPHAFDTVMGGNPDVRALFNHDSNIVLGRTTAGTLRLSVDARGLAYEIDPPDTQAARDLMVSMKRGDITQSSYGFIVKRDQWADNADGSITRRVLELDELFDVSPVTYPAYTATAAQARDLPSSMPAELRARVLNGKADTRDSLDGDGDDDGCELLCDECRAGNHEMCSNPECRCDMSMRSAPPVESDAAFRQRLALRLQLIRR